MKITKDLFQQYVNTPDGKEKYALANELRIECVADMDETFYIWAVNHGEKNMVMSYYQMNEKQYSEARELWADEEGRHEK